MSSFLNSLEGKLTTMEQMIQALPGELDSIVAGLDRGKLRSLGSRLNRDCNELNDKQFAAQRAGALTLPFIIEPTYPYIREITSEDLQRWREAYKSEVRVVIGKGRVEVITPSELAREYKTTVSQIILAAQRQGYTVLGWEQYQNLLDEIGNLIGADEKSLTGSIVGILVITPDSTQGVKMLPKSLPS